VNGQVYTALSRCRTLNGIILKRKLRKEDLITDKRIIDFHRKNSPQSINDLLDLDLPFAVSLLSLYYPFDLSLVEKYWADLEKGDAHYSVYIDGTDSIHSPSIGLCFNQNLQWTDQLRSRWDAGLINPLTGNIEGAEPLPVEIEKKEALKQLLPLKLRKELKFRNKAITEHWCAVIAPHQDWENDEHFEEPARLNIETLTKEYEPLTFETFKQLYETDKTIILFNDSIWKNTLKDLMTPDRVNELLTHYGLIKQKG
jgi:hypothetical protein